MEGDSNASWTAGPHSGGDREKAEGGPQGAHVQIQGGGYRSGECTVQHI